MERLSALLGLGVFIGFAYLTSINRKAVRWQPVLWGFALQIAFALIILRTAIGFSIFSWLGSIVSAFLDFSDAGASFVFGENFQDFFFAFKVLPTIIFFSAVISVLYHYGVLQWVVGAIARVMMRTMKTSGSETLSAAGNIFVGQTEAPLLIKPYVASMTMSELHAVMTGGFATVAGGVLAAYVSFGIPAEHLIAASVMSAPAALAISNFLNSRIVERFGMRRISHSVLILFIVLALTNVITLYTVGEKLWLFYPLFCLTFGCFGMLGANFTAMAMEPQGKIAGTASAAYGFASTTVASLIGYLVAGQFDGTIAPFMWGFVALGVSSLTIIFVTERFRLFRSR